LRRRAGIGIVITLNVGACIHAPKVEDVVLTSVASPSGKIKATVIERNVGLLNPPSILVMLHDAKQSAGKGTAVVAITEGSAPSVKFESDTKVRIRIVGGTKHNQQNEALGVAVIYE
jgi:hypothetical protein